MLMPKELRKYSFTHALRGYSASEVEEYIDFLIERYEEVYRENDELTRKLEAALRALDSGRPQPAPVANISDEAKRAAARMLLEAETQKKRIVRDAEEYADRIIAEADAHVAEQAKVLDSMRQNVLAFRDDLYARYSQQIDQIEAFAAAAIAVGGVGNIGPAEEIHIPSVPTPEPAPQPAPEEDVTVLIPAAPAEEESEEEPASAIPEEIAETDEAIGFLDASDVTDEPAESVLEDDYPLAQLSGVMEEIFAPDADEPEETVEIADEPDEPDEPEEIEEIEDTDETEEYDETEEPDELPEAEDEDDIDTAVFEEIPAPELSDLPAGFEELLRVPLPAEEADDPDQILLDDFIQAAEEDEDDDMKIVPDGDGETEAPAPETKTEDGERSDEDLLAELRQVFNINFESFSTETKEEDSEFDFLDEDVSGDK